MAKERAPKTEADLQAKVDEVEGITFGYIGNFESWGDDRLLYLWVDGLRYDNGNLKRIWTCEAKRFDNKAYYEALQVLHIFSLGYQAAKLAQEEK